MSTSTPEPWYRKDRYLIPLAVLVLVAVLAVVDSGLGSWLSDSDSSVSAPSAQPTPTPRSTRPEPAKRPLTAAKDQLAKQTFSRQGLIDELVNEGYKTSTARHAVRDTHTDWREQAARSAKDYRDFTFPPFNRKGLIGQLSFEGFTHAQAVYGVRQAL